MGSVLGSLYGESGEDVESASSIPLETQPDSRYTPPVRREVQTPESPHRSPPIIATDGNYSPQNCKVLSVQEPWLTLIFDGFERAGGRVLKLVEGRVGRPSDGKYWVDQVVWIPGGPTRKAGRAYCILNIKHYTDLESFLAVEWWRAAPQCPGIKEAKEAYLSIKNEEGEAVFSPERVRQRGGILSLYIIRQLG